MKEKEKIADFPETPHWTVFFDGPLYQKYDEFMKTKDFSKILINTKLRLGHLQDSGYGSPSHSVVEDLWHKEQDADPAGNTYQYVSEEYFQRNREDEKRRTRRTRAFILLGFVIMAALAFGTALVIHYFFIPPFEERNPNNIVNVSFSENTTDSLKTEATKATTIDVHDKEATGLLDKLLEGARHHDHDHDHVHSVHQDGKESDDHLIAKTQTTTLKTTVTSSPTTQTIPTQSPQNKTEMYVLNLIPETQLELDTNIEKTSVATLDPRVGERPKHYTSTMDLNHMDFFGMDEYYTTTHHETSTFADYDFFALDGSTTTDKLTTVSTLTASPQVKKHTTESTPNSNISMLPIHKIEMEVADVTATNKSTSNQMTTTEQLTIASGFSTTLASTASSTDSKSYNEMGKDFLTVSDETPTKS